MWNVWIKNEVYKSFFPFKCRERHNDDFNFYFNVVRGKIATNV